MATKVQRQQRLADGLCPICAKNMGNDKTTCKSCKEYNRQYQKKRRSRLIESGLCVTCGKRLARENRKTCLECYEKYTPGWTNKNRKYKCSGLQQRLARKKRVIDYYGGKCLCCGESGLIFLTIDHIAENGAEHRRQISPGLKNRAPGGDNFYRWLETHCMPDGFQTLCYNCNIGKHRNGGICPHRND